MIGIFGVACLCVLLPRGVEFSKVYDIRWIGNEDAFLRKERADQDGIADSARNRSNNLM